MASKKKASAQKPNPSMLGTGAANKVANKLANRKRKVDCLTSGGSWNSKTGCKK